MDYFFGLGFDAYNAGHPRAPWFSAEIQAALKDAPVGDPFNLTVMGWYSRGWDSAAEVAADAVLAAS